MEPYQEGSGTAHSQYNLNLASTELMADFQREAFTLANNKRFNDAFDRWQSIRMIIEPRFEQDETNDLDELEKKFWTLPKIKVPANLSTKQDMITGQSQRKNYILSKIHAFKRVALNNYIKCLMGLMRTYKVGMTDKEKVTRLN